MLRRRRDQQLKAEQPVSVEQPWDVLRLHPGASRAVITLDQAYAAGQFTELDWLRISAACTSVSGDTPEMWNFVADVEANGVRAAAHHSGVTRLSASPFAEHKLTEGRVRLGVVTGHNRNPQDYRGATFGVNVDALRTSMLVIGPPGSGKTRSFALPIVEHLVLQSLANRASVLVMDPKGDDFDYEDWFDYTIDPLNPTVGFSLYGGSDDADEVADRLASAMLPSDISGDKAYFIDAGKNALYFVLAPFKEAFGRWPRVGELLELLNCEPKAINRVRAQLGQKGKDSVRQYGALLDRRVEQAGQRVDPARGLIERFSLLDRPKLTRLFDDTEPRFEMREMNRPIRVRVVLPEAQMPDASRFLARLITSQFVQVVSSSTTNRNIFKGFVCDESGPFVDQFVARAVQKVRSNNAGLVLLAQSLTDFDKLILPTLLGSVGCRALFGNISPEDAKMFSAIWGTEQRADISYSSSQGSSSGMSSGQSNGVSSSGGGWFSDDKTTHSESSSVTQSFGASTNNGMTRRMVETAIWSPGELVNQIPPRHCILSLASSTGERTPPLMVNLGS